MGHRVENSEGAFTSLPRQQAPASGLEVGCDWRILARAQGKKVGVREAGAGGRGCHCHEPLLWVLAVQWKQSQGMISWGKFMADWL